MTMAEISIQTPSILFYFPDYEYKYKRMQVFDKPHITYNGKVLENDITTYAHIKVVNLVNMNALDDVDVNEHDYFYIGQILEKVEFDTNDGFVTFYRKERYTPVLEFPSLEMILVNNRLIIPRIHVLKSKVKWRAYCQIVNDEIHVIKDYRRI